MVRSAALPWLCLSLLCCGAGTLHGQPVALRFHAVSAKDNPKLHGLSAYRMLVLDDPAALGELTLRDAPDGWTLQLDDLAIEVTALPLPERRPQVHLHQPGGERVTLASSIRGFAGRLTGPQDGAVRIVLGPKHIGGGFIRDGRLWHLEPLWWHAPGADPASYLLYADEAILPDPAAHCGCRDQVHSEAHPVSGDTDGATTDRQGATGCREVDYTVAADWLFFEKYGSAPAAEARIQTVMALVELQYSGHFDNEYLFLLHDIQLSACPTCDPPEWTGTTNAANLLINFRDWAEAGGLVGSSYDVAGLWTGRTFDNGLVGVAYIEGVCNADRYQSISDFSANSGQMRWLVSHEFGHNFSSQHDAGSGFIMSPTVNASTQWSGQSKTSINQYTETLGCLEHCIIIPPPLADFEAAPTEGCAHLAVQFNDLSIQDPTAWQWTFPGGTPSASTAQHPLVTYPTYGEYPVTLVVSNAYGADTLVRPAYIRVEDVPVPAFDWVIDGRTVYFEDRSQRAEQWSWDFGDGAGSTLTDPVHTYAADGTRVVTLQASNGCGTASISHVLSIWTPPVAGFGADTLTGCAPLDVQFLDSSSTNVQSWRWYFPGGIPDSAHTQAPPAVRYTQPGSYDVRLVVQNPAGSDTLLRTGYIQVQPHPDTFFTWSVLGDTLQVQYAGNVDSLRWQFGDGFSSDEAEAIHGYAQPGEYVLMLTVWSPCGRQDLERSITIQPPPRAGFQTGPRDGCAPLTVVFTDTSSGQILQRLWSLPGADPAFSADSVVVAMYATPGWYDVRLVVSDGARSDTLEQVSWIRVADPPVAMIGAESEGLLVLLRAESVGADTHAWDLGDGTTAEGDSLSHTYALPGAYIIRLTAANGCATDTAWLEVEMVLSGWQHSSKGLEAEIWPNPASERMFVRVDGMSEVVWTLSNLAGRPLLAGRWPAGEGQLAVGGLASGVYVLHLQDSQFTGAFRILITR
jgi:PKD repeat protein